MRRVTDADKRFDCEIVYKALIVLCIHTSWVLILANLYVLGTKNLRIFFCAFLEKKEIVFIVKVTLKRKEVLSQWNIMNLLRIRATSK